MKIKRETISSEGMIIHMKSFSTTSDWVGYGSTIPPVSGNAQICVYQGWVPGAGAAIGTGNTGGIAGK